MKKMFFYSLAVLFLVGFSACEDDEDPVLSGTSDVQMNFVATYDDAPVVMGETYAYEDGLPLFFTRLKFYLSDIELVDANDQRVTLSEVEEIDFTNVNTDAAAAADGFRLDFSDIPAGEYVGLSFGMGLNSELNATAPADYPASHPLSETSDYWSPWASYIFSKVEGKADTDGDDSFAYGFAYHAGGDPTYRTIRLEKPITISNETATIPTIEIDFKKVLVRDANDYLDIQTVQAVHTDAVLMEYMMSNYEGAFEMQ